MWPFLIFPALKFMGDRELCATLVCGEVDGLFPG